MRSRAALEARAATSTAGASISSATRSQHRQFPPNLPAVSLSPLPTTVATFAGIDGDSCDQLGTLLSFVAIMSAAPGLHSQAVAIPDAEKRNGPQPTAQHSTAPASFLLLAERFCDCYGWHSFNGAFFQQSQRRCAGAHGEAVLEKWMLRGLAQIKDLAPFENFALFVEDTELVTSGERFLAAAPKALASKRFA